MIFKTELKKHKSDKKQSFKFSYFIRKAFILLLITSLSAVYIQKIVFPQQRQSSNSNQSNGTRSGPVRAKAAPARQSSKQTQKRSVNSSFANAPLEIQSAFQTLATADFNLVGLAVTAGPSTQTVPKNTQTIVQTSVQVPDGVDPQTVIAGLNPNYRVRGELTGPSLAAPMALDAAIGQPLNIPPLTNAGDHIVQNLRVVDTGVPGDPVVTSVAPDSCGLVVIDRLLVSEVQVNELTYDQILQAGINLDDSYRYFNFVFALGTTSGTQNISIPVAFPPVNVQNQFPVVGSTITPPGFGTSVPDILPVMLEIEEGEEEGGNAPVEFEAFGGRIPGAIVFPGRVGLLNQFFEAIVLVSNGAPNGTPLVIRNLRARANLPDSGTPGNPSDDPLRIAETQTGGRVSQLDIHGLGPDGRYGTSDDTVSFAPGQAGQATFLLEGLREGLHTVNFDLEGQLDGLPSGPVRVKGQVPGAVLVRDASFSVTFTHPSVVRAGQTYDLGMTIYNSGNTNINGAFAELARNSISGATLIGTETQRPFQGTIPRGAVSTVKWRLRANVTGAVTASYVKVGDGVSAGLALTTGVGDRNVPLSPDSLILPDSVSFLPSDIVEASREMLGQAWSVANAPPGALPQGVQPIQKQFVVTRAVELGVTGLRAQFGEPLDVSLETLLRDWLGENQPNTGFADALKNTPAGYHWFDTIGARINQILSNGATFDAIHQTLAEAESGRSPFVSALVTQEGGQPLFSARLINSNNKRVGFGSSAAERFGELQNGASLRLGLFDDQRNLISTRGQMLLASNTVSENWTLELDAIGSGPANISVLMQSTNRSYRQIVFNNVLLTQGSRYRVVFKPLNSAAVVLQELRNGTYVTVQDVVPVVNVINEPDPQLSGAIQVTPQVLGGGDKHGRLLGLLFSKPMTKTSAENVSRYQIGGGNVIGSNPPETVGGPVRVTRSTIDLGDRFVFLALDGPVGPYIERNITINGLVDKHGMSLSMTQAAPISMRVSPEGNPPGGYLTGRALSADGTPVANAIVKYFADGCETLFGEPVPKAATRTDSNGRYQFDYVRTDECGAPFQLSIIHPGTGSAKTLSSYVVYNGQHLVLDAIFLARGNVQGSIYNGDGSPAANAYVTIIPEQDVLAIKTVRANAQGRYSATDFPVGFVSVKAIESATTRATLASGIGAGSIEGAGLAANVNVTLQSVNGLVGGRVVNGGVGQTPVARAIVEAKALIPGFTRERITVGYAYTAQDGSFTISNLPVGNITLNVMDPASRQTTTTEVQLTNSNPENRNIFIALPGFGNVSGQVLNELGQPVPNAYIRASGSQVRADAQGNYTVQRLREGYQQITAQDPATGFQGSTTVQIRIGETATGANIIIFRPATISGRVYLNENGTNQPAAGIFVTYDGEHGTVTNAQGNYTLGNVAPNQNLTLRFVDTRRRLAVNMGVTLSPGESLTRDAVLRSASLHGRITQPDGVTGTIAQVSVYLRVVELRPGPWFGTLTPKTIFTQSAADGTYSFQGLVPGDFSASASNVFFPIPVHKTGVMQPNADVECNMALVDTLAGKIQGRVFQPDGTTPVGSGVKVVIGSGGLGDVTATTDETGRYEFAEVFAEGGYALTATDALTGYTNRIHFSVKANRDAFADIRLRGRGNLRVRVVDGAGLPARSGSITLDSTDYPSDHRYLEITPELNGVIDFDNLIEGQFAISATQLGLGGRTAANVVLNSTSEVTIQLQASGTVQGKVFYPDGVTPIGLADVYLISNGRSIGFTTTSDVEDNRGFFTFQNVPTGDFTINVLDNRTGRAGRSAGKVSVQGQVMTADVRLLTVGTVAGRVTSNGNAVAHALVTISAQGHDIRGVSLQATTDADGLYRFPNIPAGNFTVYVTNAPGGQTGSVSGTVAGTAEPLPDTIANIVLEPSVTVTGTVFKFGGTEAASGAKVIIQVNNNRRFETLTDNNGVYRLNFIPLGPTHIRAEAANGYDRGESTPITPTQPGETVVVNFNMKGVGSVSGTVQDNNGTPLTIGTVSFVNNEWRDAAVRIDVPVVNGRYEIAGAPVGNFSLGLSVPNRVGGASANGNITAGQNTDQPLKLEDAAAVTFTVKDETGATPVTGADVTLTLRRNNSHRNFFAHTDSAGRVRFENIPLGTVSIQISDVVSGGLARLGDVILNANGQTVDLGDIRIDSTPIRVLEVTPATNAINVPTNAAIKVTFSEPALADTINSSALRLIRNGSQVGASVSLSTDGRVATITPSSPFAETTTYTIVVNSVKDHAGLQISDEYRSVFTTADERPPFVITVFPTNGASEIAVDTNISITFNEPLNQTQTLTDIVKITFGTGTRAAGTHELDATGRKLPSNLPAF